MVKVCEAIEMMNKKAAEEAAKEQKITTLLTSVRALMENMGWTAEQAMSARKVSSDDQATLKTML